MKQANFLLILSVVIAVILWKIATRKTDLGFVPGADESGGHGYY